MNKSVLIAGFGGQGVMLIGQLLGYCSSSVGKNATFYPAYGAEQRGGTANCTVVISDEEIGSPVVKNPDVVLAMNEPSMVKFQKSLKSNGTLIINSSLVKKETSRKDINVIRIPAIEIAEKLGSSKATNMVMLGSYLQVSEALPLNKVIETMKIKLAEKAKFLPINELALKEGMEFTKKYK